VYHQVVDDLSKLEGSLRWGVGSCVHGRCIRGAMLRPLPLLVMLAPLFVACGDEPGSDESFATALPKSLTLRLEVGSDGALSLKSSGKSLACFERFDGLAGERISCSRSGEKLQILIKDDGTSVLAVRDLGKKRGYYACSRTGDAAGAPAEMKCKLTTIEPRGSGGLSSPFDASVEGVSVPNSHWVNDEETILRGMEPRSPEQYAELKELGVSRVVVFKNMTGKDTIDEEIAGWGLPEGDLLHVPFQWKDFDGFETPCEQTVAALRFIRDSVEADERVFFHCTVGEDRTGYLAAMYALVFEGADPRTAFEMEMCEHGYASGNPQKPGFVLGKLDDHLTPLYRSMAFLVADQKLNEELDPAVCAAAPEVPDEFLPDTLACGVSTTLEP
jgi:hypothetical protein